MLPISGTDVIRFTPQDLDLAAAQKALCEAEAVNPADAGALEGIPEDHVDSIGWRAIAAMQLGGGPRKN
ncbi:MAG: hypothetical protein FJX60_23785 [Alphaproteobacteria bacterium]|nr:hypothetical protein [Alphaproteobacteria bacterium]